MTRKTPNSHKSDSSWPNNHTDKANTSSCLMRATAPLHLKPLYNNKPIDGSERTKSLFKWDQLTILARLRDQFRLGSLRENFSPVSEMRKGDEFWRVIRKNKAKMAKHKVYHSLGILLANSCIIAVQMGWQPDWSVHMEKFSSPLSEIPDEKTDIPGTEPACPLIWTHRKFYKAFKKVMQEFGNWASLVNPAHVKRP